jgi:hypothetical protein
VVPVGFGPNGGEVWVAAEDRGVVFAVRNDGTVSVITREIPGAEYVRVIPTALAELEASGGAYFTADYPQRIVKYPASDFAGLGGNVLVGQEVSGGAIMMISESGGAYSVSPFDPHAYTGSAEGAAFAEPGRALLVYAAKFLCGRFEGESEQLEGPVKPGNYRTAINIHNPNRHSVAFVKKAVLLFAGSTLLAARELEVPRPPGKRYRLELRPDWGVEIDCRDIREVLLRDAVDAEPTVRSPVFIKGWVVVESASALDVEVVYTAHGLREGRPEGFAMTTERVLPTNITTDWTHSR